jgi:hypothetical protein
MILCKNLTAASYVIFATGNAAIHLVKVSIAMNKNLNPPGGLGKMPTMLIPQIAKARRDQWAEEFLHASLSVPGRIGNLCIL